MKFQTRGHVLEQPLLYFSHLKTSSAVPLSTSQAELGTPHASNTIAYFPDTCFSLTLSFGQFFIWLTPTQTGIHIEQGLCFLRFSVQCLRLAHGRNSIIMFEITVFVTSGLVLFRIVLPQQKKVSSDWIIPSWQLSKWFQRQDGWDAHSRNGVGICH